MKSNKAVVAFFRSLRSDGVATRERKKTKRVATVATLILSTKSYVYRRREGYTYEAHTHTRGVYGKQPLQSLRTLHRYNHPDQTLARVTPARENWGGYPS